MLMLSKNMQLQMWNESWTEYKDMKNRGHMLRPTIQYVTHNCSRGGKLAKAVYTIKSNATRHSIIYIWWTRNVTHAEKKKKSQILYYTIF